MAFDDGDKSFIKLAVMEGFEAHRDKDHAPMAADLDAVKSQIKFWKGALWIIGSALTIAVALIAGGR